MSNHHTSPTAPATAGTESTDDRQRVSILAVFGFVSIAAAARHHQARWDAEHPDAPLHTGALIHGIHADMNFCLPEPFTIETPGSWYVTGPALIALPTGPASPARTTFHGLDMGLFNYTVANVRAHRAKGHGGYPWETPMPKTVENAPAEQLTQTSGRNHQ